MDPHCEKLASVGLMNFSISLIILVGILISYLPQHIRIINRRSSFGLSPYFVLLGTTSGTCAFANILVLPASRRDMGCCHEVSGFACFAGLLGVAQVGVQWSCFVVILLLFLIFFPRATPPDTLTQSKTEPPTFRTALAVTGICLLHAIITIVLSLYFVLARPHLLQEWANFLGIFSTVLASIQYFPQIYTTFMLKRVGALSIPMMCIQTPGSFLWAYSLAMRLGPSGWSAWGIYCVTGCLQGTLLGMGSYFEIKERQRQQAKDSASNADGHNSADVSSERTPLLDTPD